QLGPYAKRKPHQLSGGQQQRVALARSLAKRPKLLLLDEPLGALDKKLREQTQFELVNIIEKVGVTCVMVTHDQEEAMTMAGRIAIMSSKGSVLQVGTPVEVYEHPVNRFVADFIGNVNLFEGRLSVDESDHCAAVTGIGEIQVGHGVSGTLNMPVAIAVRPEKMEISKVRPSVDTNVFTGRVKDIAYFGSYNTYIVIASDGSRVKITEANTSHQDLSHITWEDNVFFWWSDVAGVVLRD
ncbi:MAG: TOBE domain-containing protein, partial [Gallionella sp.]|nr:TOBE domain-containing protein [Gallionella sp.]